MKVVNINDIEDLILAKHEIDVLRMNNNEISERSLLQDFINSYATPKYIYLINDKQLAFNYIKIYDNDYLFVTDYCDENELIISKIKHLKFDMNNLTKLSNYDLMNMTEPNNVIIYNSHYYN
jgi:hypothetical protein